MQCVSCVSIHINKYIYIYIHIYIYKTEVSKNEYTLKIFKVKISVLKDNIKIIKNLN